MAAGQGFKTFTTGEVLTAGDVNGYLMQGINVFASSSARSAAITSPQEGQYSYLKDTNALEYYDGSAWVGAPVGDITAVTAGKGLTGGGSSGDVTVSLATTAKGDLVAGSGASTAAVLTVGNNGETLMADSSTSTGLRYQAPYSQQPVLNSAFQVWQRGTSFAGGNVNGYTADRWIGFRGVAGSTFSRQTTSDTTNLPNIQYCMRVQRDSGNTATSNIFLAQPLETVNSIPFAGKTVTFSFYARKGANFSVSAITGYLTTGTGTDQNVLSGYTGAVDNTVSATLTTTWQRFSVTATLPTNATEIAIQFGYSPTGTAGAADYFEVTGVQLELGSVATPFHTYAGTIQGELAACQRYFYRFGGLIANEYFAIGTSVSATTAIGYASPKVSLRGTPTLTFTTASNYRVIEGTSQTTATSVNAEELSANNISFAFNASGFTIGRANRMNANNTTNGYIDISAEL